MSRSGRFLKFSYSGEGTAYGFYKYTISNGRQTIKSVEFSDLESQNNTIGNKWRNQVKNFQYHVDNGSKSLGNVLKSTAISEFAKIAKMSGSDVVINIADIIGSNKVVSMSTVTEALKLISSVALSKIKIDPWIIGDLSIIIANYHNAGRDFENMRNL